MEFIAAPGGRGADSNMSKLPQSKPYTSLLSALAISLVLPISAQAADNWVNGRTADGQPELQGLWTNDTITPMERPASMAGKQFHSDDEIAAMETRIAERRAYADDNIVVQAGGNIGGYNQIWMDSGDTVLSTGQTSMIVDPPDGRAPIRPEAEASRDYGFAHVEDHWTNHTVWDRCITRGVPGSMLPAGYNNAYRIIQTADTITIIHEMIHDVRVIPLNKSAHLDSRIKLWMGDSVAHWEGETLIVETTNYNDRGMIANSGAGGRLKGVPVSESLHVVERFTRISENTIIWEARITDPVNFTQPFTISTPLTRDDEYVMYEYACHEGNTAIANILNAGRAAEQQ
jgi:hypothetical protein